MQLTPRLRARIERDFGVGEVADQVCRLVIEASDIERVQAAIVLTASGRMGALRNATALAQVDWRDLLMNVGLADDGWPMRLDSQLGRHLADRPYLPI